MRLDLISRVLFILYCVEAGALFLVVPWTATWDRMVLQIPVEGLKMALLDPITRSLVSGFGVLHLVWAVNDLDGLLAKRASRDRSSS